MTATEPTTETGVTVNLNGTEITASKGELLIDAAERNGVYIPRFCYHPRMKPVGMCRMCLVEVDTGRGPGLQPSCMVPVSDGMTVDTESDVTKKAQDGILEFLLINHPLDCPVCDKGGECPLQDQTMAYGPGESRFVEEKRHFQKPIPISDIVYLDRERCILCDRCTRFASEVAGDPLIHFQSRGNQTEVNTFPDEPFSSYFSGNTVQICPVGALTAKPYRFKARPWDLTEIASTAVTDSVGARITVQSSRNQVLRYLGVDSDPVNWGWLSDKERFSFEVLNSEARITSPLVRGDGLGNPADDGEELVAASWPAALSKAAAALKGVAADRIGVMGGARMSNEAQYAWAKLAKSVLATDNVDAQLADGPAAEVMLGLPRATIDQACASGGTTLLIGADPKETHGSFFLRLRDAAANSGATLLEVNPRSTGCTPYASQHVHPAPGELASAVAAMLDVDGDDPIGAALRAAEAPVICFGSGSLAEAPDVVARAVTAIAAALPAATFLPLPHRGNIMGALDMGLAPGLLPGRRTLDSAAPGSWTAVPAGRGKDTMGMLHAAAEGELDVLILLGADPLSDVPDRGLVDRALNRVSHLIAVDCVINHTSSGADVVFPAAATATEIDGSFTNIEGRVSPVNQKVTPPGTARADWMIAAELAAQLGADLGFIDLDELWADLGVASPLHVDMTPASIAEAGTDGVVVSGSSIAAPVQADPGDLAYGDGLRLVVTRKMYDGGTMLANCPSLAGLAADPVAAVHPETLAGTGFDDGTLVRLSSSVGDLELRLAADGGVPVGAVAVTANHGERDAGVLIDSSLSVTTVTLNEVIA